MIHRKVTISKKNMVIEFASCLSQIAFLSHCTEIRIVCITPTVKLFAAILTHSTNAINNGPLNLHLKNAIETIRASRLSTKKNQKLTYRTITGCATFQDHPVSVI